MPYDLIPNAWPARSSIAIANQGCENEMREFPAGHPVYRMLHCINIPILLTTVHVQLLSFDSLIFSKHYTLFFPLPSSIAQLAVGMLKSFSFAS